MTERQIVHLDLESFYINCTLLKMPDLSGKPLIIGGTSSRGIVMSASREAQLYGVKNYMPTRLALQRCPDAVVLKGDFDLFTSYSETVNEILKETAPVHERSSIHDYYMDMTGMDRFFGSLQFTKELSSKIYDETGLSNVFGLSINKTVAKMCSNFTNSGGMYVQKGEVQPFLDPQSIRNLPSLGDTTYRFLRRLSIKLIRTFREVPRRSVFELLGKQGETLWQKANGVDNAPVIPFNKEKAISTDLTFDKDTQNIKEVKALLTSMIEKVAFQMRESGMMCSTISVRIRYSNFDTETRQKKIPFTSNDVILINHALELFEKLYERRMLLRLVGVKLSNFVSGNHQIDLFEDNVKAIRLHEAMDRMKHRYKNPLMIRRAVGFSPFEDK